MPASLQIERIGQEVQPTDRTVDLDVSVTRQLYALGDFIYDNLKFFLDFGAMPEANSFVPPMDMTEMVRPPRTGPSSDDSNWSPTKR